MKNIKFKRGTEDLVSTGGNSVIGLFIKDLATSALPLNFQSRRLDAIADRDILLTTIGMLSNSRSDFTNVNLYANDTVLTQSFGIGKLASESTLAPPTKDIAQM